LNNFLASDDPSRPYYRRQIGAALHNLLHIQSLNQKISGEHDGISKSIYSSAKNIIYDLESRIGSDESIRVVVENTQAISPSFYNKHLNHRISSWEFGKVKDLLQNYLDSTRHIFYAARAEYSSSRCSSCGCDVEKGYFGYNRGVNGDFDKSVLVWKPQRSGDVSRCTNAYCPKSELFKRVFNLLCTLNSDPSDVLSPLMSRWGTLSYSNIYNLSSFSAESIELDRDINAAMNFSRFLGSQPSLFKSLHIISYSLSKFWRIYQSNVGIKGAQFDISEEKANILFRIQRTCKYITGLDPGLSLSPAAFSDLVDNSTLSYIYSSYTRLHGPSDSLYALLIELMSDLYAKFKSLYHHLSPLPTDVLGTVNSVLLGQILSDPGGGFLTFYYLRSDWDPPP
jgi:hypothetical protein